MVVGTMGSNSLAEMERQRAGLIGMALHKADLDADPAAMDGGSETEPEDGQF